MNRDAQVDLAALHDAIRDQLAAEFPQFNLVDCYIDTHDELQADDLPALIFELVDMETAEDRDPGTEQWAVMSRWAARVILPYRTPQARLAARVLAANLATYLHKRNRWAGMKGGEIMVEGAFPDDFAPELDRFEVWRVEWSQCLHIGPTVFTDDGVIPTDVKIRTDVDSYRLDGKPLQPGEDPFPPGEFGPFAIDGEVCRG